MDYKYIECLVERYFSCQSTLEEERILRDFFRQQQIPEQLAQYKPLFGALQNESETMVSADFDSRLQSRLSSMQHKGSKRTPRSRFVRFNHSLTPFYKAVASIALIITVGVTSSKYWGAQDSEPVNYNYASYHDTYSDPEVACEQVTGALKDLSDALKGSGLQPADSVATENTPYEDINNKSVAPAESGSSL